MPAALTLRGNGVGHPILSRGDCADSETSTADAGFAGVGRYGVGSKDDPIEVVMASAEPKPDFEREWAVLGSNQ